jgi:hypothetical protein
MIADVQSFHAWPQSMIEFLVPGCTLLITRRGGAGFNQARCLMMAPLVLCRELVASAGATIPQIASISGHSVDQCTKIIDTYLPRRTETALVAIQAWENQEPAVVLSFPGFDKSFDKTANYDKNSKT